MAKIAVIVTNQTEDIELFVPVDVWRRMGFKVTTISVLKTPEVVLANANRYIADTTLAKVKLTDFDTIFFPGGTGVTTLNEKNAGKLISYVQKNCENKKILITSICAATGMLGKWGIIKNRKATGYPGTTASFAKTYVNKPVVTVGNLITAPGPGKAFLLAFAVGEYLAGKAAVAKIKKALIY